MHFGNLPLFMHVCHVKLHVHVYFRYEYGSSISYIQILTRTSPFVLTKWLANNEDPEHNITVKSLSIGIDLSKQCRTRSDCS